MDITNYYRSTHKDLHLSSTRPGLAPGFWATAEPLSGTYSAASPFNTHTHLEGGKGPFSDGESTTSKRSQASLNGLLFLVENLTV